MENKLKLTKKRGITALIITGTLVGVGVGTTKLVKKISEQKVKSDEMKRLKELEDESFDDLFE